MATVPRDYYELLGVDRNASAADIKKRFRRLARELHPDVNREDPHAEEKFKEIAEAYEVLSDDERRAVYDRYGHEGLRSRGYESRFDSFTNIADIFDSLFGGDSPFAAFGFGGRGRGGAAPGDDVAVRIELTLDEAAFGGEQEVEYEVVAACDTCHGDGARPGTTIETCARCSGMGQVRAVTRTPLGQIMRTAPCDRCGGKGRLPSEPCPACHGRGVHPQRRRVKLDIPAGIEDGQRIRVAGRGHAPPGGGPAGDLYALVSVAEDERFERHGDDLVTLVDISAPVASLGTTVRVPTIDGEDEVIDIPAGVQPRETIRLRARGVPHLRRSGRGDLIVVVNVVVPRQLDAQQRELAERFAASLGEQNLQHDRGMWKRIVDAFK